MNGDPPAGTQDVRSAGDLADLIDARWVKPAIGELRKWADPAIDRWATDNPHGYGWVMSGALATGRDVGEMFVEAPVDSLRLGRDAGEVAGGHGNALHAALAETGRLMSFADPAAGGLRGATGAVARDAGLVSREAGAVAHGMETEIQMSERQLAGVRDEALTGLHIDEGGALGPCTPGAAIRATMATSGRQVYGSVAEVMATAHPGFIGPPSVSGEFVKKVVPELETAALKLVRKENPATIDAVGHILAERGTPESVAMMSFIARRSPADLERQLDRLAAQHAGDPATVAYLRSWIQSTAGHDSRALYDAMYTHGELQ